MSLWELIHTEKGWNLQQVDQAQWLGCDTEEVANGWGLEITKLGENAMFLTIKVSLILVTVTSSL